MKEANAGRAHKVGEGRHGIAVGLGADGVNAQEVRP